MVTHKGNLQSGHTHSNRKIQDLKAGKGSLTTRGWKHIDQQVCCLSEMWELWGSRAGMSASMMTNWLTWIPKKIRPDSTRRINIGCTGLFRLLGPRVFRMNVRWPLKNPLMVSRWIHNPRVSFIISNVLTTIHTQSWLSWRRSLLWRAQDLSYLRFSI